MIFNGVFVAAAALAAAVLPASGFSRPVYLALALAYLAIALLARSRRRRQDRVWPSIRVQSDNSGPQTGPTAKPGQGQDSGGQGWRADHQARSSARAASAPSGPRSSRSSSRCR